MTKRSPTQRMRWRRQGRRRQESRRNRMQAQQVQPARLQRLRVLGTLCLPLPRRQRLLQSPHRLRLCTRASTSSRAGATTECRTLCALLPARPRRWCGWGCKLARPQLPAGPHQRNVRNYPTTWRPRSARCGAMPSPTDGTLWVCDSLTVWITISSAGFSTRAVSARGEHYVGKGTGRPK